MNRLLGRGVLVRGAVILALLLVALFALPAWFDTSWIDTFTSVAIYAVVSAGLVVLYGKVGMISLGQFALLAVGTWTGLRLNYLVDLPFPLLLLATGAVTCVVGVVIGLPALRLSGLFLALITLMGAGAITLVLRTLEFPNGGGGFSGHRDSDLGGVVPMVRPSWGTSEVGFYRYTVIVCALVFLLALAHFVLKPGRAWAAIRESEPAALAAGVNITLYKLWAFALASFMTGVAGLPARLPGRADDPPAVPADEQPPADRDGDDRGHLHALGCGRGRRVGEARALLPPDRVGRRPVLADDHLRCRHAPGVADRARRDRASSSRRISPISADLIVASRSESRRAPRGIDVIEVESLTVRFAGVTPIDDVTVVVPRRRVRADRAERRRQDDVLQRAQRLRQAGGGLDQRVRRGPAQDGRLPPRALGPPAHVPDRAGDRDAVGVRQRGDDPRALEGGARPRVGTTCSARSSTSASTGPTPPVGALNARDRRLVELARAVVGQTARRPPRRAGRGPARRGDRAHGRA